MTDRFHQATSKSTKKTHEKLDCAIDARLRKIPTLRANVALAHPYHVRKSCSKFGQIPLSGLGGGG